MHVHILVDFAVHGGSGGHSQLFTIVVLVFFLQEIDVKFFQRLISQDVAARRSWAAQGAIEPFDDSDFAGETTIRHCSRKSISITKYVF